MSFTDELNAASTSPGSGRSRSSASGGLFGTPPWRRAPWLLARQPIVFLALVLAAAVLAVATSSGPLFLASAGTAALHINATGGCPQSGEPGLVQAAASPNYPRFDSTGSTARLPRDDAAVKAAMIRRGLPSPYLVAGSTVPLNAPTTALPAAANLFYRPGALDHVVKRDGGPGRGVWIPADVAANARLRAGSNVTTAAGKRVRIAGVFGEIGGIGVHRHIPSYWCTWYPQIVGAGTIGAPPIFLATDLATFTEISPTALASWYSPIGIDRLSVPQARADDAAVALAARAVRGTARATESTGGSNTADLTRDPGLATVVGRAELVHSGLRGPIVPVDIAGGVVALLLVAGAAGFWAVRRSHELALLVSRGVGPVPLAAKALLEIAPAVLLGSLIGWIGGIEVVRMLGPSSVLEPGAPGRALVVVGLGCAAALVLVGAIGAATGREGGSHVRIARIAARIPWELAILAGALAAYVAVRDHRPVTEIRGTVQVSSGILAFPLLALAGGVLLLCRLSGPLLAPLRRLSRRAGTAIFLAVRRISGSAAVAVGLAIGVALPVGLLVYAGAQTASVSHSVTTKFRTYLGADHALGTVAPPGTVLPVDGHGTTVSVIPIDARLPDGKQTQVIAVQPATFARFAAIDRQQVAVTGRLTVPATGEPVPALWINARGATPPPFVYLSATTVRIAVVASARVFPGLRNGYHPMVVIDRAALAHIATAANISTEVWTTNAQYPALTAALARHHVGVVYEIDPSTFVDHNDLLPVTWIFDYVRALAVLAGVVAVAALIFALAARTRRRTASYVLAARMGLRRRTHRFCTVVELTLVVGFGWVVGAAMAVAAAALTYRRFDVNYVFPPPPSFVLPVTTIVASGIAAVVLVILAAVLTQWLADRANPAEILRLE